ncbi:hypothetical protein C8J56DRAFT_785680, partial [Mycena floridula]
VLTPSFALSGILPDRPTFQNISANELDAFLAEMERDVGAADRGIGKMEALEITPAMSHFPISDYGMLKAQMHALASAHYDNLKLAAELESRTT